MKIPRDKQMHWLAGLALGGCSASLALIFGWSLFAASACAIATAIFAGLTKEIYDQFHPQTHTADKWDAVATMLGGLSVVAVIAIMRWMRLLVIMALISFGVASCGNSVRSVTKPSAASVGDMLKADESLRNRVSRLTDERNKLADQVDADAAKLATDSAKLAEEDKALAKSRDDLDKQRLRIAAFIFFGIACIATVATLWLPVAKRLLSIIALASASLGAAALVLRAIWPSAEYICSAVGIAAVLYVLWIIRGHTNGLHEIAAQSDVDEDLLSKRAKRAFAIARARFGSSGTAKLTAVKG